MRSTPSIAEREQAILTVFRLDGDEVIKVRKGLPVRTHLCQGYPRVHVACIKGWQYKEKLHRVKWCLRFGHLPVGDLDHRNRHREDSRLSNLRETTARINNHNRTNKRRKTSGLPRGVAFRKGWKNPWQVRIREGGRLRTFGTYSSKAEAANRARYEYKRIYGADFMEDPGWESVETTDEG